MKSLVGWNGIGWGWGWGVRTPGEWSDVVELRSCPWGGLRTELVLVEDGRLAKQRATRAGRMQRSKDTAGQGRAWLSLAFSAR